MAIGKIRQRPAKGRKPPSSDKPSSSTRQGRSTTEAVSKKKKSREPKAFLAPQAGEIEDELVRDAGEMIDASGSGSEQNDIIDVDGLSLHANGSARSAANFLLQLDERQVSRTNAETKRLRQQELARERANNGKSDKGKNKAAEISHESGDVSTDMEGASIDSDVSDGEDDITDLSETGSGVEFGEESEDEYAVRFQRKAQRQKAEEEAEALAQKRKRLPTRKTSVGWDSGEDRSSEDLQEDSDGDQDIRENRTKKARRELSKAEMSRAVKAPLVESDVEASVQPGTSKSASSSKSTILTASRFGMQAPYAILTQKKKSERLRLAREQIARLSTEIVNDPELTLGLVRRLAVFAGQSVTSPDDEYKRADVDDTIRGFAILSLCAVFTDILPGYRIRDLTEVEKKERVNQELARRREWEQGLVVVYRHYLELCERVARRSSPLFAISVKAMCTLAVKATQFNYRTNLVRSLVSCLSRKSWDNASQECSAALVNILKSDRQGEVSLEIVRMLNRMIKERRFQVHAGVLDILCHLRLRDELAEGKRADTVSASGSHSNDMYNKKLKSKDIRKGKGEHLSKKGVKRVKEMREIAEEMKEAEAEINKEERERHHTETLKLLFVLYFSILKATAAGDHLVIAALRGLRLFAHRINIEFFRDLLSILRVHVRVALDYEASRGEAFESVQSREEQNSQKDDSDQSDQGEGGMAISTYNPSLALHCIVTSLELLNGQGEALNLDLSDIVAQLYQVMIPLCNHASVEELPASRGLYDDASSVARLLLRALHLALVAPQRHAVPAERLASFVVRMSICALHMPAKTSLALLDMVQVIVRRNDAIKTLLDSGEDRARNGHFDPSSDAVDGLRPLQAGVVLWQLASLEKHVHDDIVLRAQSVASTTTT